MKKITRILAVCLCAIMIASMASVCTFAATESISGAGALVSQPIKLNGKDTGATLTQAKLDANTKYAGGTELFVSIVEADPSDPLISFETLNGGSYNHSKNTMGKEAVKYNETHAGETVLAAINTDPWFVHHKDYTGDGQSDAGTENNVKHVGVFRGVMIVDGELWATQQIADEGNMSCGTEGAGVASTQASFAYTSDGKAFIGDPVFRITVKNDTQNNTVPAQGINRLAAPNSIIIYNQRCGTESYAHADAYEIYLECESQAAIKVNTAITGTVTHIFESGDTSARPAIGPNTIVISARGANQIEKVSGKYAIGDSVTVNPAVAKDGENNANKDLWNKVETATGGFWTIVLNGTRTGGGQGTSTRYPCPIVGIKKDGTVLMITQSSCVDGTRNGLTMDKMYDLVVELGCTDALMFDGGGSAQMVTLEGNDYIRRCSAADGANSVRSVVNGFALVYHEAAQTVPVNQEKKGIQFLDGLGLEDTETYTPTPDGAAPSVPECDDDKHVDADGNLICDVCSAALPDPNAPVIPEVVFTGSPSWAYFYAGTVTSINGVTYDPVYGMRNPAYDSGWSSEEKETNARQPATMNGSEITLLEGNKLAITGWAFANGSQKRILWSVDKENWYEVHGGEFSNASNEAVALVTDNVWVKSVSPEHGAFTDVEILLNIFAGQTVDVHLAVTPGADDKALHFMTIEDITIPVLPCDQCVDEDGNLICDVCGSEIPAPPVCEEHVDADGNLACDVCGAEVLPPENSTEGSTEAPTEAPTEDVTETPTEAPTETSTEASTATPDETSGCGSSAAISALAIVSAIAVGAFATKKKEE